jgi:hypothetical protein
MVSLTILDQTSDLPFQSAVVSKPEKDRFARFLIRIESGQPGHALPADPMGTARHL